MSSNRSCHGCTKRYVTKGYNCHIDCPDYEKDVKADAEKKRLIQKAKAEEAAFRGVRQHAYEVRKHGG